MENEILKAMLARRSVRKYTGEAVSDEAIEAVVNAGLTAPTGRNLSSVEFLIVRDKAVLDKLSKCRPIGPGMLAGADVAIVVMGAPDKTDVWTEDASIAMAFMHLQADSLGLGSCWVQIRNRMFDDNKTAGQFVKEELDIPENYEVEAILSLGVPAEHAPARAVADLDRSLVHVGRF